MRYSRLLPYQNAVLHSSHYFGYDSGRHFGKRTLQRALVLSNGDWTTFFTRPISCVFIIIAILSLFYPFVLPMLKKRKAQKAEAKNHD